MSLQEEYEHRLTEWSDIQGHMAFLRETAAGFAAPRIIELGVRYGESTSCFLAAVEETGGSLWSVDKDEAQVPEHWRDLPHWHFLKADDVSEQAQEWLPSVCDLLFIDTSHELDHTLAELRLHMPRVRPGGIALFHDTQLPRETGKPETVPGYVAEALDRYCAEAGLKWTDRPGFFGMGVIQL